MNRQLGKSLEQSNVHYVSSIRRVSKLVDSITDSLYMQIINGTTKLKDKIKLPIKYRQSQVKSQMLRHSQRLLKYVDPEQHKKKVINFIRANKNSQRKRQMKLAQLEQKLRQNKLSEQKSKQQQRNRTIQLRIQDIKKRKQEKQKLMKLIRQSIIQSNINFSEIKTKKPLFQQKQQEFNQKFIVPKIQQEKRILQKKKQLFKPINILQLLAHQKEYSQKKKNHQTNRIFKNQIISHQKTYTPPKFVSQSYLILTEQQQIKKVQQQLKVKQLQINQIKKKKFLQDLRQMRINEANKIKKIKQNDDKNQNETKQIKQNIKVQLTSQQTKKIGNQYMEQVIRKFKKSKIRQNKFSQFENQAQNSKKKIRNQYQLQLVKEQRIQKVSKIRVRKIESIINSNSITNEEKIERLRAQSQRLDGLMSGRSLGYKFGDLQQSSSILLNSINAKVAILQLD